MVKRLATIFFCLLIVTNLYAEDETPTIELLEFLADWEQEEFEWLDSNVKTQEPKATKEKEVDDETQK